MCFEVRGFLIFQTKPKETKEKLEQNVCILSTEMCGS